MMAYFDEVLEEIRGAIQTVDEQSFKQLVMEGIKTLESGGKIIATGLGKNVPICEKFVGTMLSLGQEAYFLHTNSAIHGDIGIVKEGDIVIILTKSGETTESIYLARLLKERKANLWLLSYSRESTLTKEVKKQIIMDLNHEGDMWNIIPNNSTTINLIVLQSLAMNILKEKKITLEEFRRNHPGGHIGELLR